MTQTTSEQSAPDSGDFEISMTPVEVDTLSDSNVGERQGIIINVTLCLATGSSDR